MDRRQYFLSESSLGFGELYIYIPIRKFVNTPKTPFKTNIFKLYDEGPLPRVNFPYNTFSIEVKYNKSYIIPVYPMERIAETINKNNINIAVITVPQVAAQEVCNKLVQAGIKGIINFSPTILKVPDDVFVNNINLSLEFDTLIYYLK